MRAYLADLEVQVQAIAGVCAHTLLDQEEARADSPTDDSLHAPENLDYTDSVNVSADDPLRHAINSTSS